MMILFLVVTGSVMAQDYQSETPRDRARSSMEQLAEDMRHEEMVKALQKRQMPTNCVTRYVDGVAFTHCH